MSEAAKSRQCQNQVFDISVNVDSHNPFASFDDDGKPRRTGTMWTASAHIITAVIGSGVLSLAWAMAQLGWIAGPIMLFLFSIVTYYTSSLLSTCYRSAETNKRNYTYTEAVRANLGASKGKVCGIIQYANLFGISIGYTIAASTSMMAVRRSNCFHKAGHDKPCQVSSNPYMIAFGVAEVFLSQIPDFDEIWWLSILAAVMSFGYSGIGLGLGISKFIENGTMKGSLTGMSIGSVTQAQKLWRCLQALGDMAFSYSYAVILIEIQDTLKSPPSESKTMKKAAFISIAVTTLFYLSCGFFGYAALGDKAPGNLLTGFGFYNPFWLIDIANMFIVVHLVGAYQVFCQPIFATVERKAAEWFPDSKFITKEVAVLKPFRLTGFRLIWRTIFVVITTGISMLLPFFNDVVGLLGAFAFWPLTVYFPVEMYIAQQNITKWSFQWICLQVLSYVCLIISVVAAFGSFAGVFSDLKGSSPV